MQRVISPYNCTSNTAAPLVSLLDFPESLYSPGRVGVPQCFSMLLKKSVLRRTLARCVGSLKCTTRGLYVVLVLLNSMSYLEINCDYDDSSTKNPVKNRMTHSIIMHFYDEELERT